MDGDVGELAQACVVVTRSTGHHHCIFKDESGLAMPPWATQHDHCQLADDFAQFIRNQRRLCSVAGQKCVEWCGSFIVETTTDNNI